MKTIILFAFALVSMPTTILGQFCPPEEVLAPCNCSFLDEEQPHKLRIDCENIQGEFNLKEILDNASAFVNESYVFDTLRISGTSLKEIGEGAVEHLKFGDIFIFYNGDLSYIHPRAFGATRNFTENIYMTNNKLSNEAPRERDIFEMANGFKKLRYLTLGYNKLTSVPSNALVNLEDFGGLSLVWNQISHIGAGAFGSINSSRFGNVNLAYNSLPSGGLPEDAFAGIMSDRLYVYLYCNEPMAYLEEESYKGLLDPSNVDMIRMSESGGFCMYEGGARSKYFDCEGGQSDWICDNEQMYASKLEGYLCRDGGGGGGRNIWEYCAGRNVTL